jgi:hypothetical protein
MLGINDDVFIIRLSVHISQYLAVWSCSLSRPHFQQWYFWNSWKFMWSIKADYTIIHVDLFNVNLDYPWRSVTLSINRERSRLAGLLPFGKKIAQESKKWTIKTTCTCSTQTLRTVQTSTCSISSARSSHQATCLPWRYKSNRNMSFYSWKMKTYAVNFILWIYVRAAEQISHGRM